MSDKKEVPIWEKACLTVDEAAAYSNIGTDQIRSMIRDRDCPFTLKVKTKTLIKRQKFLDFIERANVL